MECERPVVGEAIEGAAAGARMRGREHAIVPLVEERSRLLASPWGRTITDPVLGDLDELGNGPGGEGHFEGQPFVSPDRGIVAQQDPLGLEHPGERRHDVVPGPLQSRREELGHEVGAVAVHDERRQTISLAVDHAPGRGVDAAAPRGRRPDPRGPPGGVDRVRRRAHQPQPDLGARRVQGLAQEPAAAVGDGHDPWLATRRREHVGPVDPRVPRAPTRGSAIGHASVPTAGPPDRLTAR